MQISRSVTRGELTAVIRYTLTDTIRNYNESGSADPASQNCSASMNFVNNYLMYEEFAVIDTLSTDNWVFSPILN